MWLKLASHLHMSLERCQEETSSSDFVLWKAYFEQDVNEFHREDYYFAQIAQEVSRVLAKKPKQIKLKHFLLKFGKEEDKPQLSREERIRASKSFWFAMTGFQPESGY